MAKSTEAVGGFRCAHRPYSCTSEIPRPFVVVVVIEYVSGVVPIVDFDNDNDQIRSDQIRSDQIRDGLEISALL
jgi:hypothetical protein